MTELEVPPDTDAAEARELIEDFVEIGDTVNIRKESITGTEQTDVTGTVTASRTGASGPDYLELDEQALGAGSVAYDDIASVTRVQEEASTEE